MVKKSLYILNYVLLLLLSQYTFAQTTGKYSGDEAYRKGTEYYDNKKYAAANECYRKVYILPGNTSESMYDNSKESLVMLNARFYSAMSSLQLENKDAEDKLLKFIEENPTHAQSKTAIFKMGKVYFGKQNYASALAWFEKVDPTDLVLVEANEYYFKAGYCYFLKENYEKARTYFSKIKDSQNDYNIDASYYYGYIAFLNHDYDMASNHFYKIIDEEKYTDACSYHLAQIDLLKGDYDASIEKINYKLEEDSIKKQVAEKDTAVKYTHSKIYYDMLKLKGTAYFYKKDYPSAYKNYNICISDTAYNNKLSSQDLYQIGYTYKQLDSCEKAKTYLEKLIDVDDIYAQFGMQSLGACFLESNNKNNARAAFQKGADMDYDLLVQEECLLNFAKLSYETNLNGLALSSCYKFISNYPRSAYINEAKALLGEIMLTSKNYREALDVLKTVQHKDAKLLALQQKVAYYRAIEMYNDRNFSQALELFDLSLSSASNLNLELQALYWKAETLFELGQYNESIETYKELLSFPTAPAVPNFKYCYYNIAYSFFKVGDYINSAIYFEKFLGSKSKDTKADLDANLRLGDCYFVAKLYDDAEFNYNKVVVSGSLSADYALYQKAMIRGLLENLPEKIYSLQNLIELYPSSNYLDDAYYEMSYAYFLENNYTRALDGFQQIVLKFPSSSYIPKSLLAAGLVHYTMADDENALRSYKSVVELYPNTKESREALLAIKNIYIGRGKSEEFFAYMSETGNEYSASTQDSISYQSAYSLYTKGLYQESEEAFNSYLEDFDKAYFVIEAHYYRAKSYTANNKKEQALSDYIYLCELPTNQFSEESLVEASSVYLQYEQYVLAKPYLLQLYRNAENKENYGKAIIGLMNVYDYESKPDSTIFYAQRALDLEKIPIEEINEAYLLSGKADLMLKDTTSAIKKFNKVSLATKSVNSAKSRYEIARLMLVQGKYSELENMVFEIADKLSNQDYWVAKSFLLLSEGYYLQNDLFQAKSTLQSIIDNYPIEDDDIIPNTNKLLDAIKANEEKKENQ